MYRLEKREVLCCHCIQTALSRTYHNIYYNPTSTRQTIHQRMLWTEISYVDLDSSLSSAIESWVSASSVILRSHTPNSIIFKICLDRICGATAGQISQKRCRCRARILDLLQLKMKKKSKIRFCSILERVSDLCVNDVFSLAQNQYHGDDPILFLFLYARCPHSKEVSIPSVSVEVKTVDFQCHRKTGTDIGSVSNGG